MGNLRSHGRLWAGAAVVGLGSITSGGAASAAPGDAVDLVRGGPAAVTTLHVDAAGETLLDLDAAAPGADWGVAAQASGVVTLSVDGGAPQWLVVRSATASHRSVSLGPLAAGDHTLRVAFDAANSPAGVSQVVLTGLTTSQPTGDVALALRHAPVLFGRGAAFENATNDTPLVEYHELLPGSQAGRRRLTYTFIFSNEDGGTSSPQLMSRWGRTVDIEYAYTLEVDATGARIAGTPTFQGANHVDTAFAGTYEGDHPLLHTCTSNNNFCAETSAMRFQLAADDRLPSGAAREVALDDLPDGRSTAAAELRRQGEIEAVGDPATNAVGDQRTYLYLEIKKATTGATVGNGVPEHVGAFATVELLDGRVFRSDHDLPDSTILRDVPASTSIELPAGTTAADVRRISVGRRSFYAQLPDDPALTVTVTSLNRAFFLGDDYRAQPSFASSTPNVALTSVAPTAVVWERTEPAAAVPELGAPAAALGAALAGAVVLARRRRRIEPTA